MKEKNLKLNSMGANLSNANIRTEQIINQNSQSTASNNQITASNTQSTELDTQSTASSNQASELNTQSTASSSRPTTSNTQSAALSTQSINLKNSIKEMNQININFSAEAFDPIYWANKADEVSKSITPRSSVNSFSKSTAAYNCDEADRQALSNLCSMIAIP